MKKFIFILILILSLQSWAKADDIRDFEIEGMSIGDSLVNFYEVSKLNNIKRYYYPNSKKYFGIADSMFDENLKTYKSIQFAVNSEKYEIASIAGRNYKYQDNKEGCYKEMEIIFDDIILLFPNSEFKKGKERPHAADKSGKSLSKVHSIYLKNGQISISCSDWTKKIEEEFNRGDALKIAIHTKAYMKWINTEAY